MFDGDLVPNVEVFGQTVDLWVEPDRDEVVRRAEAGLGSITSPDLIRALMTLPVGIPVPTSALGPIEWLLLQDLGAAIVAFAEEGVTRLARPPVRIIGIVKRAHSWRDVQAVTLLRTHAPRLVVTTQDLATRVLREADPEIGVVRDSNSTAIREPGNRWVKPSWQRWLSAEVAFEHWRRLT